MKALVLSALNQLELKDIEPPRIHEDEMLIRTGATTICTSDVNDLHENPFGITFPIVIGHEGAGTVVEIGEKVHGFQVGDRVATHPVHPCGNCSQCQAGLEHLCRYMAHFGYNMPGTMAEYYRVRQDRARLIPGHVSFPVAALTEPVCVCLEALEQAHLSQGGSLLIVGDGPFGVLMTRLAARYPLRKTVITGWFDFRMSFTHQAVSVNIKDSLEPVTRLLKQNDGEGFDAVILAVSSRKAFSDGLKCLKPRGRMVVFSALPGETPVDLLSVHLKELEIVGACSDQDRFDEAIHILDDPSLELPNLVTHEYRLSDFRNAFKMAEFGKDQALKVSFVFP